MNSPPGGEPAFRTTRWSVVLSAGQLGGNASRAALAELCRVYWYPLYAFARRRGYTAEDAADVVQAFFTHFIEANVAGAADPARGRFRSYVLRSLSNFMSNERDRQKAKKRGGDAVVVSCSGAEARYQREPASSLTAENLFERRWALTLLETVREDLRREYAGGKAELYDHLKDLIAGPLPDQTYAQVAQRIGMTEGALKVAVFRLRQRYGELLKERIGQTVDSSADIEDELRHLFAAVAARP